MVGLTWTSDLTEAPIGDQAVTGRPCPSWKATGQVVSLDPFRELKNAPAASRSNRAGNILRFPPILKTGRSSNDARPSDSCELSH